MSGPITVVGTHVAGLLLHVERVPGEGESVLGSRFEEPEDGGKATNQAVAIARLGTPVRIVTLLGNDERGRRWRAILARYGVDTAFVQEADGPTDVGVVLLPPGGIPAIASVVALSQALDESAVERAEDAIRDASLVVCQLEAPLGCALAAFRLGRRHGAPTLLNPAPSAALDDELLALTDVLIPNEHEAVDLVGMAASPGEHARLLPQRVGGGAAIVTAGADGCYLALAGGPAEHLPAPSVAALDTTGAGDAFVGALAVRLRAGDELRDATFWLVRAAAVSVGRPGTMPAYATADEVAALAPVTP